MVQSISIKEYETNRWLWYVDYLKFISLHIINNLINIFGEEEEFEHNVPSNNRKRYISVILFTSALYRDK